MIKEAMLYKKLDGGKVLCLLCAHRCKIQPDKFGICGVRENKDGKLCTHVYGKVIASHVDPIEKKPLYHFFPGSSSYSIATVGCNFKCPFCQNWQISQASKPWQPRRLPEWQPTRLPRFKCSPEEVVAEARKNNCKGISYTYTEPTIFFEYAYECARIARAQGLYNSFVTNGYMTDNALETISPYLDACNVDLKSFSDNFYKEMCQARLAPVLDSIKTMKRLGIWVEITTLVVPGENDSEEELKEIAGFIASLGPEIPWHISRFHPDYKYLASAPTGVETLKKAREIGKRSGLRYIYLGNVLEGNNTYCYNCKGLLIERLGFDINKNNLDDASCPSCKAAIDGRF